MAWRAKSTRSYHKTIPISSLHKLLFILIFFYWSELTIFIHLRFGSSYLAQLRFLYWLRQASLEIDTRLMILPQLTSTRPLKLYLINWNMCSESLQTRVKVFIKFIYYFSIIIIIYLREFGFAYKGSNFFQNVDRNLASRNGGSYQWIPGGFDLNAVDSEAWTHLIYDEGSRRKWRIANYNREKFGTINTIFGLLSLSFKSRR